AKSPAQQRARAPGEHAGIVERDGRDRIHRIVERDALPDRLYLRFEYQPRRQCDRVASLDRSGVAASLEIVARATDGAWGSKEVASLHQRVDVPVRRTEMSPIPAVAAGIEIDVASKCAWEAIDKAMDGPAGARLGEVEANMVAVTVGALEPPQIRPDLEAGKGAVEVRLCPLRKVLALLLAEYTAPCTDPH